MHSHLDEHGNFIRMETSHMKSFIGDDGVLHVVADRETIKEQLQALDLPKARTFSEVGAT